MASVKHKTLTAFVEILRKSWESEQHLFESLFDIIRSAITFESATLFLHEEPTGKLSVMHKVGDTVVDLAREIPFDGGPGLSGWIAQQKKPLVFTSLTKSRPGKEHRFNSFLSLPLWVEERLLGVVNLGHTQEGIYRQDEIEDYEFIAVQVSLALEQLLLRKELRSKNERLRNTLEKLKEAQHQLIEQERMAAIGEITVTVNHQINNPLTSIIGHAELMLNKLSADPSPDPDLIRHLETIIHQGQRIQHITQRLKEIERSTADDYVGDIRMVHFPQ